MFIVAFISQKQILSVCLDGCVHHVNDEQALVNDTREINTLHLPAISVRRVVKNAAAIFFSSLSLTSLSKRRSLIFKESERN